MTDAFIAGAFEHPTRRAGDKSVAQIHAEVAAGALKDAGLTIADVDGYFCAGDAPGMGPMSMLDYLGLDVRYFDSTDTGGSSYLVHVAHAVNAIAAGQCKVALITLGGRPKSEGMATGTAPRFYSASAPDMQFEFPFASTTVNMYAMVARRHMHEYGTTLEDLAWIKWSAGQHAQHNERAVIRGPFELSEIMDSPAIADPLRRHDCCVISDGGGAIVVVAPEIARTLNRPMIQVKGHGAAVKHLRGGHFDLTFSAGAKSAPLAFEMAGVTQADIDYASIYDSFTITVLIQLEDLGFCEKGQAGRFVRDGNLVAGIGKLPVNTDGGGLCNNHPANRGGMTKIIEAVRQLRGEAHPKVQVDDCRLALVHGTGGSLGARHASATLILERVA
jgi:acetyl-CoA C-acetyltransferase